MRCVEPANPCAGALADEAALAGGLVGAALRPAVLLLVALLAGGCSPPPEVAAPTAPAAPSAPNAPTVAPTSPGAPAGSRGAAAGGTAPIGGAAQAPGGAPAQGPPRRAAKPRPDWETYRRHAAERIVAMNPDGTYGGPVPEPLLAIPVLQIELNGDGSVRRIQVLRQPGQALDTVQLAMAAVRRAAPFAPVSHLPRPWVYTETFLFDGQRRFKPRSLDT